MFSWCLKTLLCKFYDFIAFRKHIAKGLQLKISRLANTSRKHFRFMCIILETENKLNNFESFTFLIVCCSWFGSHSSDGQFSFFFYFFLFCKHSRHYKHKMCKSAAFKSLKGKTSLRFAWIFTVNLQNIDLSLNRLEMKKKKKSPTVHVYLLDRTSCCLVKTPVRDSRVAPPIETMLLHHMLCQTVI